MGLELKITGSDGRRYKSIADMFEAETTRIFDNHIESIRQAIARERCPTHGERPKVSVSRRGDQVKFSFETCCEGLHAQAQAAADRASRG